MLKLEVTEKYRVENREEAKNFIKTEREEGPQHGYVVTKAGYVHKDKKAKGEVVDECEIVTITKKFNEIWNL